MRTIRGWPLSMALAAVSASPLAAGVLQQPSEGWTSEEEPVPEVVAQAVPERPQASAVEDLELRSRSRRPTGPTRLLPARPAEWILNVEPLAYRPTLRRGSGPSRLSPPVVWGRPAAADEGAARIRARRPSGPSRLSIR